MDGAAEVRGKAVQARGGCGGGFRGVVMLSQCGGAVEVMRVAVL